MAKQFQKTTEEYRTAAMLLGMRYDPEKHMMHNSNITLCLDPDTMEPVYDDRENLDGDKFNKFIESRRFQFANYHRR